MSHRACLLLKVSLMDNLIEELVSMAADLERESDSVVTVGVSDCATDYITDISLITENIRKRYAAGYVYTKCGPRTLLVVPTADDSHIHREQLVTLFADKNHCHPKNAHLYQLCSEIHLRASDQGGHQAIIFHGSNTNDSLHYALEYFDKCSGQNSSLPLKLLDIWQLYAVFTNVSTESLRSSSRMGLCIDLCVDFKGDLSSMSSSYFAFDRCCLMSHSNESEQLFRTSFHIFYALLNGASVHLLKSLKLHRNLNTYNLLRIPNNSSTFVMDQNWAKQTFCQIEEIFSRVNVTAIEMQCIWQVIAAILKLTNLQLQVKLEVDGSLVNNLLNPRELEDICLLLGIAVEVLETNLLAAPSNGSTLNLSVNSSDTRCSSAQSRIQVLCRVLYARLFHLIFSLLNSCMSNSSAQSGTHKICLLASPAISEPQTCGSHFQEFLTNYAIERLHCFYQINQFSHPQSTYIGEGLQWETIDIDGCSDEVVEHIEASLTLLDQCSDTGVKVAFRNRMQQAANAGRNDRTQSACFFDPKKDKFVVQHFWDKVTYNPNTFVDENLETISNELVSALSNSKFTFIQKLFPEGRRPSFQKNKCVTSNTCHKKRLSVASQCQLSLSSIQSSIKHRECSHVISLKPNGMNAAKVFDADIVQKQLQGHRICELSQMYHLGYSTIQSYNECLCRYRMLSSSTWPHWDGPPRQGVMKILSHKNIPQSAYALGRTKLFWKSQATVHDLECDRNVELSRLASIIQRAYKKWIEKGRPMNRFQNNHSNAAQIIIAKYLRAYLQRRRYLKMRDASTIIAAYVRGWQVRRRYRCLFRSIAADKINQFLQNCLRRRYLVDLRDNLPSVSPNDCDWPSVAPNLCRDVDAYLKTLFHRWRCRLYRQRIDQQGYFRMREKLAASIIFRDKKAGYYSTVGHPFRGDYVRLRQNPKWRRISIDTSDEYVVFADMISKIHRATGKVSALLMVVSTSGALILDHRTLSIRHRVGIMDIQRVSLSPYADNICVLHLTPGKALSRKFGDFVLECRHVIELVSKLYLVVQNATASALPVNMSSSLYVEAEEGTLEVVFCAPTAVLDDFEQTSSCFSSSPSSNLKHSTSQPEKIVRRVFSPPPGASAPLSPSSTPTELTPTKRTKFIKKGNILEVHF